MENTAEYLHPTDVIDSESAAIVRKTTELTQGCSTDAEKARKLFYFVRDEIPYSVYMISMFKEDFVASTVLEREKGYCVQKAVLLTALSRAAGIPSRLRFAAIRNHRTPARFVEKIGTNVFSRHGYNQLLLDGRWVSMAATFDKVLCEKNGLTVVEFDGVNDAILPPFDIEGNPYIEYVEKFGPEADLPLSWIVSAISRVWGEDKRPWLSREH
ncbi:MAG: transglutaminase domain-containing protein [Dehalococcoidia bacterium]|nr:transglutaminase domain-containing protein [Dehalococcoidia bacterium]